MTFAGDNEVSAGVFQHINSLFFQGRLKIHHQCRYTLMEAAGYSWNEKTGNPNKIDDHAMDALRYGCKRVFPTGWSVFG